MTDTKGSSQYLSDMGKKLSFFGNSSMETLRSTNSFRIGSTSTETNSNVNNTSSNHLLRRLDSTNFVIDDDEDDGMGPKDLPDTTKISISKTDVERAQALALHKMNGLIKGDQITISRSELPGAILFPAIKYKDVDSNDTTDQKSNNHLQVHRYLVVSRERFIVLDSNGEGIGSKASVKSAKNIDPNNQP